MIFNGSGSTVRARKRNNAPKALQVVEITSWHRLRGTAAPTYSTLGGAAKTTRTPKKAQAASFRASVERAQHQRCSALEKNIKRPRLHGRVARLRRLRKITDALCPHLPSGSHLEPGCGSDFRPHLGENGRSRQHRVRVSRARPGQDMARAADAAAERGHRAGGQRPAAADSAPRRSDRGPSHRWAARSAPSVTRRAIPSSRPHSRGGVSTFLRSVASGFSILSSPETIEPETIERGEPSEHSERRRGRDLSRPASLGQLSYPISHCREPAPGTSRSAAERCFPKKMLKNCIPSAARRCGFFQDEF